MHRLGQILVNGTITNATITASGVSTVYIIGLENYATVNLAGTANVYVKPANGDLASPELRVLKSPCYILLLVHVFQMHGTYLLVPAGLAWVISSQQILFPVVLVL